MPQHAVAQRLGGGLNECQEKRSFERVVPSYAPLRHETFDWSFPAIDRPHHPGAGCANASPSSAEEGSKM